MAVFSVIDSMRAVAWERRHLCRRVGVHLCCAM